MLVTLKALLQRANVKNLAVGGFNVSCLETLQAILSAAEKENEPVAIQFLQAYEETGVNSIDDIGPIMMHMAERASVPVSVHLDHCVDLGYLKRALDMGFTSVMYDGSSLPFDENVANTVMAVEMAERYGASVEAEIGVMGGATMDVEKKINTRGADRSLFTCPEEARKFVELTGVDCLACSFGTSHGMYRAEPALDYELVTELKDTIGVPVVMHGGSGLSEESFRRAISAGVRKINYYTYMALAGGDAVRKAAAAEGPLLFENVARAATDAMEGHVRGIIRVMKNQ